MPTTAQLGSDFHAAAPDGVVFALSVIGRWLATISQRSVSEQVLGEGLVHRVGLQERLGVALRRARVAGDVEDRARVGDVERRPGPAQDLEHRLALVGDERVDVDQRSHVAAGGPGVGDDPAAVGVADQHHGAARALGEERGDVRRRPVAAPRSRFGGAKTVKSWLRSSDATAFQLDPSAQAPWTRTIVGFGMSGSCGVWGG